MKALELLKEDRDRYLAIHNDNSIIKQYNEAIKELEALTTTQQTIQNKFKVGDWVVYTGGGYCGGEVLQITNIDKKDFCSFSSYDKLYHIRKLRLWRPKPDEWCWVSDGKSDIPVLRKFVCVNNTETNTHPSYPYKVKKQYAASGTASYKYIEPFIGVLPSAIEQY